MDAWNSGIRLNFDLDEGFLMDARAAGWCEMRNFKPDASGGEQNNQNAELQKVCVMSPNQETLVIHCLSLCPLSDRTIRVQDAQPDRHAITREGGSSQRRVPGSIA